MKRYDIEAECTVEPMNADMYERPNGAYVRWDDLIAAGVLVPVPDGEACRICDASDSYIIVDGKVYFPEERGDWCGLDEGTSYLHREFPEYDEDFEVQPVRLVKLEDVG